MDGRRRTKQLIMKKKPFLFLLSCVLIIGASSSMSGCYYDVEEELYGFCDTTNVTFSGTVNNLLTSYGCIGCHSGTAPSGGFSLVGHAAVKAKAQGGRMVGAINHAPGFSPMPQGGAKMNQCDIDKIEAWINAGAPNN
jgi:hypothetical protein